MSAPPPPRVVYEFGPFRFEPAESRLLRGDTPVALGPKALETLAVLVAQAGRLVGKSELLQAVWPDSAVEESSLAQHIYLVRRALGEERGEARYIETVPKRGYRFCFPVRLLGPAPEPPAPRAVPAPDTPVSRVAPAWSPQTSRPRRSLHALLSLVAIGAASVALWAWRAGAPGPPKAAGAPAAAVSARTAPAAGSPAVGGDRQAYDAYVRGLFFWKQRTEPGLTQALRWFAEAVQREPEFAAALAGLADARALAASMGYGAAPRAAAFEGARREAQRALQLDSRLAEAHATLAFIHQHHDHDRAAAEREYRRALQLDPRHTTALQRLAQLLAEGGRLAEATATTERALALDPNAPALHSNLCYLLYLQRQYDRAAPYCDRATEIQPDLAEPLTIRALIEGQRGRDRQALGYLDRARRCARGSARHELLGVQGWFYVRSGRTDLARATLEELKQSAAGCESGRLSMLDIHVAMRDSEKAFALLRECARERRSRALGVNFDPRYDGLRDDPRYREVVSLAGAADAEGVSPAAEEAGGQTPAASALY